MYSLGVVLFELLTGQRPYAHLTSRRPDELARAICEQEPPHPSTVAGRTLPTTATATVPAGRVPLTRERPTTLRRLLAGDLDNVVAKALRKEPARRYASALALSEDIRRHCEGLPVTARRDTVGYRAGTWARASLGATKRRRQRKVCGTRWPRAAVWWWNNPIRRNSGSDQLPC